MIHHWNIAYNGIRPVVIRLSQLLLMLPPLRFFCTYFRIQNVDRTEDLKDALSREHLEGRYRLDWCHRDIYHDPLPNKWCSFKDILQLVKSVRNHEIKCWTTSSLILVILTKASIPERMKNWARAALWKAPWTTGPVWKSFRSIALTPWYIMNSMLMEIHKEDTIKPF